MQNQCRKNASETIIVCVDSYNNGIPCGCFYPCGQGEKSYEFQSLTQLIIGVENFLDSGSSPQSFTAIKTFSTIPELELKPRDDDCQTRQGEQATFIVKILFRQHTSWQGIITWLENETEQSFRSALELVLLMDSALNDH